MLPKKRLDVKFDDPSLRSVFHPPPMQLGFEPLPREIGSLAFLVRGVVIYEMLRYLVIEIGIAEGTLNHTVAMRRGQDLALLRLVNDEAFISLEAVCAFEYFPMDEDEVGD